MSGKGKRRRWTAAEKLRIVLAGLDGSVGVSELCRREGINPTLYYGWKKQLLGSAAKVFDEQRGPKAGGREGAAGGGDDAGEERDRGDHGREPGAKKRALGLEDHGQLPAELQREVHAVVQRDEAAERLAGAADALRRWACRRRVTIGGGERRRACELGKALRLAAAAGAVLRGDCRRSRRRCGPTP